MKLLLAGILVLLISIPLTISLLQQNQDTRTRAAGATSLSLVHPPDNSSHTEKTVGESVPITMMIEPGSNSVTFVRFQIKYDPTKLEPVADNPFTVDATKFPTTIEGPIVGNGTISMSISVGSDPTKAIRNAPAKVGTANFKAKAVTTDMSTEVSFSNLTQALSSGADDQSSENVLSYTSPATVSIIEATASPTPEFTPTPTLSPDETTLSFTLLLHGIGEAGDNPNPTGNTLSNKNPKHQQRNIDVSVYDVNEQLVTTKTGTIIYDVDAGNFKGSVSLGNNFASGPYSVKIKSDRYLRRLIPSIQTITHGQEKVIPVTQLVAGDTNGDNTLNILDYSALLDCGYGVLNPLLMTNSSSEYKRQACQVHTPAVNIDVDDNGIINSFDYNLFLRELSVQNGD